MKADVRYYYNADENLCADFLQDCVFAVRWGCPCGLLLTAVSLRLGEGKTSPNFLYNLPIDKRDPMWYNSSRRRAAHGGQGPFSRPLTPYAKFLRLLAGFPKTQIFPKFNATHMLINAPATTEVAGVRDTGTTYAKFLQLLAASYDSIFS